MSDDAWRHTFRVIIVRTESRQTGHQSGHQRNAMIAVNKMGFVNTTRSGEHHHPRRRGWTGLGACFSGFCLVNRHGLTPASAFPKRVTIRPMSGDVGSGPGATLVHHGLDQVGASLEWFRARLSHLGVSLRSDSSLGEALSQLEEARREASVQGTMRFASRAEGLRFYRRVTGADFLSKALHWGESSGLVGFDEYFRLLKKGDPVLTDASGRSTHQRNEVWELLLASLIATFAQDVRREEPDITCYIGQTRFGLAAKVLYSDGEQAILRRVQDGANQLERSRVDVGVVAVNLVELIPHDALFANLERADIATPSDIAQLVEGWVNAFMTRFEIDDWIRHLNGRGKLLAVAWFVPTLIHMRGVSPPPPYYRIHELSIIGREEAAQQLLGPLNAACQRVLGWRVPAA